MEAILYAAERSLPADPSELDDGDEALARRYVEGLTGPTALSRRHREPAAYERALEGLDVEGLEAEAHRFAESMRCTGLVAPQLLPGVDRGGTGLVDGAVPGPDGNGTQEIFYRSGNVLYVDTHATAVWS